MQHSLQRRKRSKRHVVELSAKKRQEKSISRGFKIWIAFYASMMLTGLAMASQPAHSAPAQPASQLQAAAQLSPALLTPNDMQTGSLLFQSKEPGRYIEAPRVASDIKIDISGPVARAIITQKFLNPSDAWLEGIYVFPLPEDAAVDHLKMKIGDRLIEGKIKKKQEARKIYEQAKREGKKASLLEQNRPNLFTNSVANIGPGESITVQIEYQQTIPRSKDTFSLRVPLVVAPRYNPAPKPLKPAADYTIQPVDGQSGWGSADPVPDRKAITAPVLAPKTEPKSNPVTLSLTLDAGFPLTNVTSENHKIAITKQSEKSIELTLGKDAVPADRDFVLTWQAKAGTAPQIGLFKQSHTPNDSAEANTETQNYLLAYITPPYKLARDIAIPPRDVTFVLDNSGSMAGPSMAQAKASMIAALKQLKPADQFQVIRFNNEMDKLFDQSVPATPENIGLATGWVQALKAEGGTEMATAMHEALLDANPKDGSLRQVLFLTDGAIGNERQLFEIIKQGKGRSRIFTIGIGSAPNSYFMTRAAEEGKGTFTHIGNIKHVQTKMAELFTKLSRPIATDLRIDLEGAKKAELSPYSLPDLYVGEPVIVAIKARDLGKSLTLKGRFDNQPWSIKLDLEKAAPSKAIDKVWARRKIRQLESDRLLSGAYDQIDRAIEKLGLDHHLVTRLTSLVAVDVTPSRPKEAPLDSKKVPLNLPDGWEMEPLFEEAQADLPPMAAATAQASRKKLVQSFASNSALLARKAAPLAGNSNVQSSKPSILLPKTATRAELALYSGLILLLTALACLVGIRIWHRHAKDGAAL
ncbi:MAG: marine proteobacterial sortase target protein [Cohaesibacter sp.]|jgi:Ca-activated chloride channel family protein|nr:marine proteobacterial sortase target protein [Cohaesibacter sp.]